MEILIGLNTKNFCGWNWNLILILRWFYTHLILVFLRDYPLLQIFCLLIASIIVQTVYIRYQPISKAKDNWFSLINEILVSVYLFVLLGMTNLNTDIESREYFAIMLLTVVAVSFLINLIKFLGNLSFSLYFNCSKKCFSVRKGVYNSTTENTT